MRYLHCTIIFLIRNSHFDLYYLYSNTTFIHRPKLLVFDEPFVGLDPEASFHLKNLMRKACQNGSAIFFSTHVLEVAEKLCDTVSIIKSGKLIASGTMEEVKGRHSLEDIFMGVVENDEKI